MRVKALFLCSELSGYLMNCIETLNEGTNTDVLVYRQILGDGAPYEFKTDRILIRNKTELTFERFKEEVVMFDPDIVYVAGWRNRAYNSLAGYFVKQKKVVVCGMDNPWTGSLMQRALCLLSPILIKPYYTHMWVAGRSQFQFARELQYPLLKILNGVYAADIDKFLNTQKSEYRKELLFVGRFEKVKGLEELYTTFLSLNDIERNGWKLRLIGNGSLKDKLHPTKDILVESFMQPEILAEKTRNAGAFILPSKREPWGVVVQEFAASGLPLILSDRVNAGEEYLIPNYNGLLFKSSDAESLRSVLIRFFSLEDVQLVKMGHNSRKLALRYTPEIWAARFLSPLIDLTDSMRK